MVDGIINGRTEVLKRGRDVLTCTNGSAVNSGQSRFIVFIICRDNGEEVT